MATRKEKEPVAGDIVTEETIPTETAEPTAVEPRRDGNGALIVN